MIIVSDLDGVLVPTQERIEKAINSHFEMSFRFTEYYAKDCPGITAPIKELIETLLWSSPFLCSLEPDDATQEIVTRWRANHTFHICTARQMEAYQGTWQQCVSHFKTVPCFEPDKAEFLHRIQGTKRLVFIEDNYETARKCVGEYRKVFLIDRLYNRYSRGVKVECDGLRLERVKSLQDVDDYIRREETSEAQ